MAVDLGFDSGEFSVTFKSDPATEVGYNTDPTIFQRGLLNVSFPIAAFEESVRTFSSLGQVESFGFGTAIMREDHISAPWQTDELGVTVAVQLSETGTTWLYFTNPTVEGGNFVGGGADAPGRAGKSTVAPGATDDDPALASGADPADYVATFPEQAFVVQGHTFVSTVRPIVFNEPDGVFQTTPYFTPEEREPLVYEVRLVNLPEAPPSAPPPGVPSGSGTNRFDRFSGTAGADGYAGRGGPDLILGRGGGGYLFGDAGDDLVFGGDGADRLRGGADADELRGGPGDDFLWGDPGDDLLEGWDGNDLLKGGRGGDAMDGERGDDTLDGELGNDTLTGGPGADTFVFRPNDGSGGESDFNGITDFAPEDRIVFEGLGQAQVTIEAGVDPGTTLFTYGGGTVVIGMLNPVEGQDYLFV